MAKKKYNRPSPSSEVDKRQDFPCLDGTLLEAFRKFSLAETEEEEKEALRIFKAGVVTILPVEALNSVM